MKLSKWMAYFVVMVFACNLAQAASVKTSTTVKNGKKITTKVKTDRNGTTTTAVTIKDQASGDVATTTTVTDNDGNIISTDDPEAKTKAEAVAKKQKEKEQALANAPKRGPNDPIQMAIFQTVESDKLRKVTEKQGGVFAFFRKEFENDKVIKLIDQDKVDSYNEKYDFKTGQYKKFTSFDRDLNYLPADIYVESNAQLKEQFGISKATKKAASAPYLFYKATIYSEYSNQTWEITESGHILKNLEVTKKFANKIRNVIINKAGTIIPADTANFHRGKGKVTVDVKDLKQSLKNLFRKQK